MPASQISNNNGQLRLYIGNLAPETKWKDVNVYFSTFEGIARVWVKLFEGKTSDGKLACGGFGFVYFRDDISRDQVLSSTHIICGRQIRVEKPKAQADKVPCRSVKDGVKYLLLPSLRRRIGGIRNRHRIGGIRNRKPLSSVSTRLPKAEPCSKIYSRKPVVIPGPYPYRYHPCKSPRTTSRWAFARKACTSQVIIVPTEETVAIPDHATEDILNLPNERKIYALRRMIYLKRSYSAELLAY